MKNEVWEKVEQIFHTALDLPVEERKLYLRRECAGDDALFSEVESLLSSFERNSDFLDEPVFELGLEAINGKKQKNLAGSVIGYYELEEKIGAGGMGEVYKAFDTRLNRRVALKFLSETLENDDAAKRRLIKEARAAAMLEHPNICAVHGIEQPDEHHFIVMQYIEGKTLADGIHSQNITVEQFKSLARQIVTAVAFAHSHGVIHRDLKPGNIMLNGDGQIKVLDFGLAKVLRQKQLFGRDAKDDVSRFSQNGLVIGTVSYMSPEQLRGEKLDYRSDIFSIGIILYELIAKQNPFSRKSQAETIAAILTDEPSALKKLAPDFPEALTSLVEKCLQKDRENRFQSAAEILVELDRAESADIRATAPARRKRFFLKTVLAAVVLLAVWTAIFFYTVKPAQRTLAVLPISFDNPQVEKEYLADGLTKSLTDRLSGLSDLKVTNEYMAASFKGKAIEPQTAGKELNVDAVFAGTIQKRGERLFLVTKLIRTSDGFVIDTNETSIEESNLIELQENISARIIEKIKSNLTDEDKNKLEKRDTEYAEAERLYFLGRFYLNRRNHDDLKKAIRSFIEATDIDPLYAKAWAGLADSYLFVSLPDNQGAIPPQNAVNTAKVAANKALALDPFLPEAYNSLGMINLKYEWNWAEAERNFREAIKRDSDFLPARLGLVSVLQINGRFDAALEEARKAKQLDSLSISPDLNLASVYYSRQDYKQMDNILSDLLERYPNNQRIYYVQGYQFLKTGKLKEATEIFERLYNSDKESDKILASAPLGYVYAKTARRTEALRILDNLELLSKSSYISSQESALIYLGLGDFDRVFEKLNKACAEKSSTLPYLITSPLFDELKSDRRFSDIKKCVNLN